MKKDQTESINPEEYGFLLKRSDNNGYACYSYPSMNDFSLELEMIENVFSLTYFHKEERMGYMQTPPNQIQSVKKIQINKAIVFKTYMSIIALILILKTIGISGG